MNTFRFSHEPLDATALRVLVQDPTCGGYTSFEGWVRNHNEGHSVRRLEYEAFEPLAVKEAERIMAEAVGRFSVEHIACVHRVGDLAIGDLAVWVGASARHRHEAFLACRYVIDEVKHRVPIWKKEHYENGDSGWVNCERCATAPSPSPVHHERTAHTHSDLAHERAGDQRLHGSPVIPDYSRQMALKEVGPAGQARLRSSRVLVVGCGGLGVPVLTYLAGAGIGRLGLVDGDRLEPSNLHRQTLYGLADVGQPKAQLAAARLRALNPDVEVRAYTVRLSAENAAELVRQHDLVIDCTDNFSTKFLLNDVCVRLGRPVIFSSVYQYEGQLQVVRADRAGSCLRCVWPEATRDGIVGNCAEAGVLGPVPGVLGSLQALEALKTLLDLPGQLGDEVVVLDLMTLSLSRVRAPRAVPCQNGPCVRVGVPQPAEAASPAAVEVELESLDEGPAHEYRIIDIREPREVSEAPTPATTVQHIPIAQLLHGTPALAASNKYLLVCASGRRSLAAAEELRARGFDEVYSLRGGVAGLARRSLI